MCTKLIINWKQDLGGRFCAVLMKWRIVKEGLRRWVDRFEKEE